MAAKIHCRPAPISCHFNGHKRIAYAPVDTFFRRHWQILCIYKKHNPKDQSSPLFEQAKARAVALAASRALRFFERPSGTREITLSFLDVKGLCLLSRCTRTLNYEISCEIPRVWKRIVASYSVSQDFLGAYSNPSQPNHKTRTIAYIKMVQSANLALGEYSEEGHLYGAHLSLLCGSPISAMRSWEPDYRKRFVEYTLPIMQKVFSNPCFDLSYMIRCFATHVLIDPLNFFHLIYICGKHNDPVLLEEALCITLSLCQREPRPKVILEDWIEAVDFLINDRVIRIPDQNGLKQKLSSLLSYLPNHPRIQVMVQNLTDRLRP